MIQIPIFISFLSCFFFMYQTEGWMQYRDRYHKSLYTLSMLQIHFLSQRSMKYIIDSYCRCNFHVWPLHAVILVLQSTLVLACFVFCYVVAKCRLFGSECGHCESFFSVLWPPKLSIVLTPGALPFKILKVTRPFVQSVTYMYAKFATVICS